MKIGADRWTQWMVLNATALLLCGVAGSAKAESGEVKAESGEVKAESGDWQQGLWFVGASVQFPFQEGYEIGDGHEEYADNAVGLQADFAWEALDFLRAGLRVAYLNLGLASETGVWMIPGGYLGLKTPSLGFLPELYADAGAALAKGRIGEEEYYGLDVSSLIWGNLGFRYQIPSHVPISGGTYLFTEYNMYIYGRGVINSVAFGLGGVLW